MYTLCSGISLSLKHFHWSKDLGFNNFFLERIWLLISINNVMEELLELKL